MKQVGWNSAFPEKISTWNFGKTIPEWLSDRAKVQFVDGDGNITLDTRETSSGGLEIMNSSGQDVLISLKSKSDIVCFGEGRLFTLSKIQLGLLYCE